MKPAILAHAVLLSSTGGAQHTMSLLAQRLAALGYSLKFYVRPPHETAHRYSRWLAACGIAVEVWPYFTQQAVVQVLRLLSIGAAPAYALLRRRGLPEAMTAVRSIIDSLATRTERWWIERSLSAAETVARAQGRPVLLHIWGPTRLTPWLLAWARSRGVPAIYNEMGEADETYVKVWGLEGTVDSINDASRLVCMSPLVAEAVRRVYHYEGPLETISGMVHDPQADWEKGRKGGGRVTFGAIGRLVPHKRHDELLRALRRLCDLGYDAGLVIAGEGPARATLEGLAAELGVADRTVFTGEFEDLTAVMSRFDIFALTSSSESQCMPVTESMAYGKPVIVAAFGGIPDFVVDGVTGLLVPLGDGDRLVEAMRRLLDDSELRAKMGARGRERYLERYTPEKITEQWEAVYTRTLATFVTPP